MEELSIEEMTALRGGDKGGVSNKTADALADTEQENILFQINAAFSDVKLNIHIK